MVFRLCRNQIAPQNGIQSNISAGRSEFADCLNQAKPSRLSQLLGRVKKKFRQYSTNPQMAESDILVTLNSTRKEGKDLLQYFSAQLLTQNLIDPHGEITSKFKGVLQFLETSIESMKNVVHDGKSLIAAVLLAELALSASLFLFACAHFEKYHSSGSGWRSCLRTCIRQIWLFQQPRGLKSSIDEILSDSMLDDDSDVYNFMLKEQLLRIKDALDAIDTQTADKALLVSKTANFVLVAVSSALRCDTGNVGKLRSLGMGIVYYGARLYKRQDRRSFAQTLAILDAQKVRRKLQGVRFGPTAIAEEGAFMREVLRIQYDVLRDGLAETHWEILVAWVDFLGVLISPDWSISTTRLSPRLVAWIVRGDIASQPDSREVAPDTLIGMQQLAALGDSSWQRNFSAAVLRSAGTTQHQAEADVLDLSWARKWDELLTEDKNPLEALMKTSFSSSSNGYRDTVTLNPTAWLHFLVLDQLQNAKMRGRSQHGLTEMKPVDKTIEIGMRQAASTCLERAADSLAVLQDSAEQGLILPSVNIKLKKALCAESPLDSLQESPLATSGSILSWVEQASESDDIINHISEKIKNNVSSSPARVLWATRVSALRTVADRSRPVTREWLLSELKRYATDDITQSAQETMEAFQHFWATVERGMLAAQRAENAVGLCLELLLRFRPDKEPPTSEWGEQVKMKLREEVNGIIEICAAVQARQSRDSEHPPPAQGYDCMETVENVVHWMCLHGAAFASKEGDEDDMQQLIVVLGNALISEQPGFEGCRPVDWPENWKTIETWMSKRSEELSSRKFPTFVHAGEPVGGSLNWVWLLCRYARLWLRTWAWIWQDCCKFSVLDTVESHQRVRRSRMLSPLGKCCLEAATKLHNQMTRVRELGPRGEQIPLNSTCGLPVTCCRSPDAGPAVAHCDRHIAQLDPRVKLEERKEQLHEEVDCLLSILKNAFKADNLWQGMRADLEFSQQVAEACKDEARDALQETQKLLGGQLDEEINDIEDFLKADDAMNGVVQFAKSTADFLEDDWSDVSEAGALAEQLLPCSSKRHWWRVRFKVALYVAVHCDRLETGGSQAHFDEGGAAMLWLMELRCQLERDPRVRGILDDAGFVKTFRAKSAMTKAAKKVHVAGDANNQIQGRNRWFIESQNRLNITLHRLIRRQFKQLEEMWKRHGEDRNAFPCLAIAVSRKAKFFTVFEGRFEDDDLRDQLKTIIDSLRGIKQHEEHPQRQEFVQIEHAPANNADGVAILFAVLLEEVKTMHDAMRRDLLAKAGSIEKTSEELLEQQGATAAELKSITERLAHILTAEDPAPLIQKMPADLPQAVQLEEARERQENATNSASERLSGRLDAAIQDGAVDTITMPSQLNQETAVLSPVQTILSHIQNMRTELVDKLGSIQTEIDGRAEEALTRPSSEAQLSTLPKTEDLTRLSQALEKHLELLRSASSSTEAPAPSQPVQSTQSDLTQVVMQRLEEIEESHTSALEGLKSRLDDVLVQQIQQHPAATTGQLESLRDSDLPRRIEASEAEAPQEIQPIPSLEHARESKTYADVLKSIEAKLAALSTAQNPAQLINKMLTKMEQLCNDFARVDHGDHGHDSTSHSAAVKTESALECMKEDLAVLKTGLQRGSQNIDTILESVLKTLKLSYDTQQLMGALQNLEANRDIVVSSQSSKVSAQLEQLYSKLEGVEGISSTVQNIGDHVGRELESTRNAFVKSVFRMEQGMDDLRSRQDPNTAIQDLQPLLGEIRDSQTRAVAAVSSSRRSVMDRMDAVFGTGNGRTVFELLQIVSDKLDSSAHGLDQKALKHLKSTVDKNQHAFEDLLQKARVWTQLASHSPMHWAYARKRVLDPIRPGASALRHERGEPNGAIRALEHQETRKRRSEKEHSKHEVETGAGQVPR